MSLDMYVWRDVRVELSRAQLWIVDDAWHPLTETVGGRSQHGHVKLRSFSFSLSVVLFLFFSECVPPMSRQQK